MMNLWFLPGIDWKVWYWGVCVDDGNLGTIVTFRFGPLRLLVTTRRQGIWWRSI